MKPLVRSRRGRSPEPGPPPVGDPTRSSIREGGTRSAYAVHRPVANEYLVRERDRRRLRDLGKVALVLAPLALALSAFTWIHLQVLDAGYRIDRLEHELHALEREESRLRLEAAYLSNPKRIERRARRELDMRPPEVDQLVFVETSRAGAVPAAPEEAR